MDSFNAVDFLCYVDWRKHMKVFDMYFTIVITAISLSDKSNRVLRITYADSTLFQPKNYNE